MPVVHWQGRGVLDKDGGPNPNHGARKGNMDGGPDPACGAGNGSRVANLHFGARDRNRELIPHHGV